MTDNKNNNANQAEENLGTISDSSDIVNTQDKLTDVEGNTLQPAGSGPYQNPTGPAEVVPGPDSDYEDQNNGVAGKEALNDHTVGESPDPRDHASDASTAATGGLTPGAGTTSRQQKDKKEKDPTKL